MLNIEERFKHLLTYSGLDSVHQIEIKKAYLNKNYINKYKKNEI